MTRRWKKKCYEQYDAYVIKIERENAIHEFELCVRNVHHLLLHFELVDDWFKSWNHGDVNQSHVWFAGTGITETDGIWISSNNWSIIELLGVDEGSQVYREPMLFLSNNKWRKKSQENSFSFAYLPQIFILCLQVREFSSGFTVT